MASGFFDYLRGLLGWSGSRSNTPPSTRRGSGRLRAHNTTQGSLRADNTRGARLRADMTASGRLRADNARTARLGDDMAIEKNFRCYRGENFTIAFSLDESRTGQTLVYRLRSSTADGTVLLTRTLGSGLTLSSDGLTLTLVLSASNTDRTPATFYWTISRTDSGSEVLLGYGRQVIELPAV